MSENIVARPDWDKAQALFQRFKYDDALPYFLAEAGRGDANALYHAGICYENHYHLGGKQKKRRALECYRRAAAAGCTKALCELGHCYREGRCGVSQDIYKALEYYRRAAEGGDSEGYEFMGMVYEYGEDDLDNWEEALRCYSIAAEMGGVLACTELAKRYAQGRGVPKDHAKTAYYYGIAARKGVNDSRYMLGCCYRDGYGVEVDAGKAFELFHLVGMNPTHHDLAWGMGCGEAFWQIAECYLFGHGVEKDAVEERRHRLLAAENGEPYCCLRAAERCIKGDGVERDLAQAARYFRLGAEQDEYDCQYRYACCCLEGIGMEPDPAEALRMARESVEGFLAQDEYGLDMYEPKAYTIIGRCHDRGLGTPKDVGLAVHAYREGSSWDVGECEYEMGRCWELGIVVPRDMDNALLEYRFAEIHGVAVAALALARYYDGEGADPEKAAWHRRKAEELAKEDYWAPLAPDSDDEGDDEEDDEDETDNSFEADLAAARAGDAAAQCRVGRHYYNEEGDAAEAVRWYRMAAEQGDSHACYLLGMCYEDGDGVPEKDPVEAARWYRVAAAANHTCAICSLAECCREGEGVPQDLAEGLRLLQLAYARNCHWAAGDLGILYENGGELPQDKAEAYKDYFFAAEKGHTEAQFRLGLAFEQGGFLPRDPTRARYWYRQAASRGHEQAAERRKAVQNIPPAAPPDHAARLLSLQAAAERGDMQGVAQLGWCYLKGRGVAESGRMALPLFRRAAEAGVADALFGLGVCYQYGRGGLEKTEANRRKAAEYFLLAAKQRHVPAQTAYARYLCKYGCFRERREGILWYRAAIANGSVVAECELAHIYLYGNDPVFHDEVEAYRLLHHAANTGCAPAVRGLGNMHCSGKCFPCNEKEARRWFRLASEMGDKESQREL